LPKKNLSKVIKFLLTQKDLVTFSFIKHGLSINSQVTRRRKERGKKLTSMDKKNQILIIDERKARKNFL